MKRVLKFCLLAIVLLFTGIMVISNNHVMASAGVVNWDPVLGSDENTGLIDTHPVYTLTKAIELAGSEGNIAIQGDALTVRGTSIYDCNNVAISRYEGYSGNIFVVTKGGSLTLKNLTINATDEQQNIVINVQFTSTLVLDNVTVDGNGVIALDGGILSFISTPSANYTLSSTTDNFDSNIVLVRSRGIELPLANFSLAGDLNNDYYLDKDADGNICMYEKVKYGDGVYLSDTGNDDNHGALDSLPVKTYKRAVEIARANNISKIYIVSDITITEDTTWDAEDITIELTNAYRKMIRVSSGTLKLDGVTINVDGVEGIHLNGGILDLSQGYLIVKSGTGMVYSSGSMILNEKDRFVVENGCAIRNSGTLVSSSAMDNITIINGYHLSNYGIFTLNEGNRIYCNGNYKYAMYNSDDFIYNGGTIEGEVSCWSSCVVKTELTEFSQNVHLNYTSSPSLNAILVSCPESVVDRFSFSYSSSNKEIPSYFEAGKIFFVDPTVVYVSNSGNDGNSGMVASYPVKTIAKAKSVADQLGRTDIRVIGTYTVSSDETFDIGDTYINAYQGNVEFINVAKNATLTILSGNINSVIIVNGHLLYKGGHSFNVNVYGDITLYNTTNPNFVIFAENMSSIPIIEDESVTSDKEFKVFVRDKMVGRLLVANHVATYQLYDAVVPELSLDETSEGIYVGGKYVYLKPGSTGTGLVFNSPVGTFAEALDVLCSSAIYKDYVILLLSNVTVLGDECWNGERVYEDEVYNTIIRRYSLYNGLLIDVRGTLNTKNVVFDDSRNNISGLFSVNGGLLEINEGTIIQNSSYRAAYAINGGTILMNDGLVTNNTGVVLSASTGEVIINGGMICNNTGTIVQVYSSSTMEINGGEIYDNYTEYSGIVRVSNNSTMTMSGGKIHDNSSSGSFGGIIFVSSNSTMTMSGGRIYDNSSSGAFGGIICASSNSTIEMNGGEVSNNEGTGSFSGVFYIDSDSVMMLYSGDIISNMSSGALGGIIYCRNGSSIVIEDGSISNNSILTSSVSGVVVVESDSSIIMNGGSINNNFSYYGGSTIMHLRQCTATFNGGEIKDNSCTAIIAEGLSLEINDLMISGNVDGIVSRLSIQTVINGGKIINNKGYGLALYTGNHVINGIEIKGNTKSGIYVTNASAIINDADIIGNKESGLSVVSPDANVVINYAHIAYNTANNGGGIYLANGRLLINDVDIQNNTAKMYGGGICILSTSRSKMLTLNGGKIATNESDLGNGIYVGRNATFKLHSSDVIIEQEIYLNIDAYITVSGALVDPLRKYTVVTSNIAAGTVIAMPDERIITDASQYTNNFVYTGTGTYVTAKSKRNIILANVIYVNGNSTVSGTGASPIDALNSLPATLAPNTVYRITGTINIRDDRTISVSGDGTSIVRFTGGVVNGRAYRAFDGDMLNIASGATLTLDGNIAVLGKSGRMDLYNASGSVVTVEDGGTLVLSKSQDVSPELMYQTSGVIKLYDGATIRTQNGYSPDRIITVLFADPNLYVGKIIVEGHTTAFDFKLLNAAGYRLVTRNGNLELALATTVYVSELNGLDTNQGTIADPFKTLEGAVNYLNGSEGRIVIMDSVSIEHDYEIDSKELITISQAEDFEGDALIIVDGTCNFSLSNITIQSDVPAISVMQTAVLSLGGSIDINNSVKLFDNGVITTLANFEPVSKIIIDIDTPIVGTTVVKDTPVREYFVLSDDLLNKEYSLEATFSENGYDLSIYHPLRGTIYYVDNALGNDNNTGLNPMNPLKTLSAAYKNLSATGGVVYILSAYNIMDNMVISPTSIAEGNKITSILNGNSVVIKRYSKPSDASLAEWIDSYTGSMFVINENATLTLKSGIVIDGHSVTIEDNSTLAFNCPEVVSTGSIVEVLENGTLIVKNAHIRNNNGKALVENYGKVELGNAVLDGASVAIFQGGELIVNDGNTIEGTIVLGSKKFITICSIYNSEMIVQPNTYEDGAILADTSNIGEAQLYLHLISLLSENEEYAVEANEYSIVIGVLSENRYQVVFDSDEDTIAYIVENSNILFDAIEDGNVISVPTLFKKGYVFNGWMIDSVLVLDGSGKFIANVENYTDENGNWIAEEATLTASFTVKRYNITLDANGGSYIANNTIDYLGTETNDTIEETIFDGNVLVGWYLMDGKTKIIDANGNIVSNVTGYTNELGEWIYDGDINLFANWIFCYVITLDHNNGSTSAINVLFGGVYDLPKITMEGYRFDGWYYSFGSEDEVLVIDGTPLLENSNHTLTAKWTQPLTVTYAGSDVLPIDDNDYFYNDTVAVMFDTIPTKQGYSFVGWSIENDSNPEFVLGEEETLTITANTTLYACFIANRDTKYVVNYYLADLAGDYGLVKSDVLEGTTDSQVTAAQLEFEGFTLLENQELSGTVNGDGSLILNAYYCRNLYKITFIDYNDEVICINNYLYEDNVDAPTPTREQDNIYTYMFVGWDKEVTVANSDITYKAVYTETYIKYEITFKDFDGETISSAKYYYGDEIIVPTPNRDATNYFVYTFIGWDITVPEQVTSDMVFVAQYLEETRYYTVTFDTNGGTLIDGELVQYVTYGQAASVPTVEKEGFTFVNWNGETESISSDVTITASWEEVEEADDDSCDHKHHHKHCCRHHHKHKHCHCLKHHHNHCEKGKHYSIYSINISYKNCNQKPNRTISLQIIRVCVQVLLCGRR